MNTSINNIIICNEPHANLDGYYGPYSSIEEALETLNSETIAGVAYTKRAVGLTVGILENDEVVEYWFKSGVEDGDLVIKTSESGGGGLPENIHIISFDKNGGTGVQNSIITDCEGQAVLPESNFTYDGYDFTGWLYNAATLQPGDVVTVAQSTTLSAQWLAEKVTVSWSLFIKYGFISASVDGNTLYNGGAVDRGKTVVFTSTPDSGYRLKQWEGAPSGAIIDDTTLTIPNIQENVSNISAIFEQNIQQYSIGWDVSNVGGATSVTVSSGGRVIGQGKTGLVEVAEGTRITLTGETEDGFGVTTWHGLPDGISTNLNPIDFVVNDTYKSISFSTGEQYILKYGKDKGITSIGCSVNGSEVGDNPIKVVSTADIEIHAEIHDKYEFYKWDYDDSVRVIESTEGYIRFNINNSTQITALSRALPAISYCATKGDEIPTADQFTTTESKELINISLTSEETQIFVVIPRYYDLICETPEFKLIDNADEETYRSCVENGLIKDGTSEITDEFNDTIGGIGYEMYYAKDIPNEITIGLKPQD